MLDGDDKGRAPSRHLTEPAQPANAMTGTATRAARRRRPQASRSSSAGIVGLVDSLGHPGPAVAHDPHDGAIDAGVQLAALAVVGEERVQLGRQGSPSGAYDNAQDQRCMQGGA